MWSKWPCVTRIAAQRAPRAPRAAWIVAASPLGSTTTASVASDDARTRYVFVPIGPSSSWSTASDMASESRGWCSRPGGTRNTRAIVLVWSRGTSSRSTRPRGSGRRRSCTPAMPGRSCSGIEPGQVLGDHQVRERAWVTVVEGTAEVTCGESVTTAGSRHARDVRAGRAPFRLEHDGCETASAPCTVAGRRALRDDESARTTPLIRGRASPSRGASAAGATRLDP